MGLIHALPDVDRGTQRLVLLPATGRRTLVDVPDELVRRDDARHLPPEDDTHTRALEQKGLVIDVFGGFDLESREEAHKRADAIAAPRLPRGTR